MDSKRSAVRLTSDLSLSGWRSDPNEYLSNSYETSAGKEERMSEASESLQNVRLDQRAEQQA